MSKKRLTVDYTRVLNSTAKKLKKAKPDPLVNILHPHWCSSDDYTILEMKRDGENFSVIADRLHRQRIAVEQRYHRLRGVQDIMKKLKASGLSLMPYFSGVRDAT